MQTVTKKQIRQYKEAWRTIAQAWETPPNCRTNKQYEIAWLGLCTSVAILDVDPGVRRKMFRDVDAMIDMCDDMSYRTWPLPSIRDEDRVTMAMLFAQGATL